MKRIKIPEPVPMDVVEDGKTVVKEYGMGELLETVCNDPGFGASPRTVCASDRIIAAFADAKASGAGHFDLDDHDYTMLLERVNNPRGGYNPAVARKLIPCFNAIERPETLKAERRAARK